MDRSMAALALGSALALASAYPAVAKDVSRQVAKAWVASHETQILDEFTTFLAMPDVATTIADVDKNADYLKSQLEDRGFKVRILRAAPDTPATVFAELRTPGAKRTVLYYAHYDGQPTAQKGWLSPPFQPTMRTGALSTNPAVVNWRAVPAPRDPSWRIYARAAGDDKASIEALLNALDAMKSADVKPSVNIKLFYEGEEEQGSPHLRAIVDQNHDLLSADLIVMGDGPMHQSGRQLVNFGSRGVMGMTLTVYGPVRPLHDGHYGSWAPSPAVDMAYLITCLRAENGDIKIPHFYDDVTPPSEADKAALAALPPVEAQLKENLGIARPITTSRLADSYFRPTLNVRAIHVGDTGPDAANAIATHADASFDFRLTPGEQPERVKTLVESYLESLGWHVTSGPPTMEDRRTYPHIVELHWDAGESTAVRTPLDDVAAQAAVRAISAEEGAPVLELPMVGASSGMAEIVTGLKSPMIGVSIANFDDNQHAENENLRLKNLWDGIAVYTALLSELDW